MFKTNAIKSTCVKKDNRKSIKSMAAVPRTKLMDARSLWLKTTDRFTEENFPIMDSDCTDTRFTVEGYAWDDGSAIYILECNVEQDSFSRTQGRYTIDLTSDYGLTNTYFEGTSVAEFDEDLNTIVADINAHVSQEDMYPNFNKKPVKNSRKAIKSDKSRRPVKSGLLDETKGQQVEQFREEIRRDVDTALNEICYNYQEKLGITTGDSWEELDIDYVTENIIKVLKDQLINFM